MSSRLKFNDPHAPKNLTPQQRHDEVANILAHAIMRMHRRQPCAIHAREHAEESMPLKRDWKTACAPLKKAHFWRAPLRAIDARRARQRKTPLTEHERRFRRALCRTRT